MEHREPPPDILNVNLMYHSTPYKYLSTEPESPHDDTERPYYTLRIVKLVIQNHNGYNYA